MLLDKGSLYIKSRDEVTNVVFVGKLNNKEKRYKGISCDGRVYFAQGPTSRYFLYNENGEQLFFTERRMFFESIAEFSAWLEEGCSRKFLSYRDRKAFLKGSGTQYEKRKAILKKQEIHTTQSEGLEEIREQLDREGF